MSTGELFLLIGQSVAKLKTYMSGQCHKVFLLLFIMVLLICTLCYHCASELQIQTACPYVQTAMCLPVAAASAVEGSSTFNQIACCLVRGK